MANSLQPLFLFITLFTFIISPPSAICKLSQKKSDLASPRPQNTSIFLETVALLNPYSACEVTHLDWRNVTENVTGITLKSSPDATCQFTVLVEPGTRTVINVERFVPHVTILSYIYVNRTSAADDTVAKELATSCPQQIVSIALDPVLPGCKVELMDEQYTVYIQANVTFSIQAFGNVSDTSSAGRSVNDCPRLTNTLDMTETSKCVKEPCEKPSQIIDRCPHDILAYDEVVACSATTTIGIPNYDEKNETIFQCDIKCPSGCQCELGSQMIIQRCSDRERIRRDLFLTFPPQKAVILYVGSMNISSLSSGSFRKFRRLDTLDLSNNHISELQCGTFSGLRDLRILNLQDNILTKIPSGVFQGMGQLQHLLLDRNHIEVIDDQGFAGLNDVTYLDLASNNLTTVDSPIFDDLDDLFVLILRDNNLSTIGSQLFQHTSTLWILDLSGNEIGSLEPGTFLGLTNLYYLYLANNNIEEIPCGTFSGLKLLFTMSLSNNKLNHIYQKTFQGLDNLNFLLMAGNGLDDLESSAFSSLASTIQTIDLRSNSLKKLIVDAFDGISNQTSVLVDNHSTCCFVNEAKCISTYPAQPFLTCGQLLPYNVLRVILSILGTLALVGNAMVMYWRCRIRRRDNRVQFLLIVNLSASDFLMGIYMIILVSGDVHFGELFPLEAEAWRRSKVCKLAGFLAVLSSEASVFFVTLISIDRLLGVKYPFSSHRLGNKSAKITITGVWILAMTLSLILTLLARIDPDMYTLSEVCIGLPMARRWINNPQNITVNIGNGDEHVVISQKVRTEPGMYLSIVIFLGLNFFCFLVIAYCYVVIFVTAQRTSRKASRRREKDEEIRMAAKMFVIVVTDFLCWMPIILMGILVQSGAVTIPPVVYAWIVTFILPINSSANPFLYTIATIISDRVGRQRGSSVDSQCGKKINGTQYYLNDQYEQVLNGHTGTTFESLEQEGNV